MLSVSVALTGPPPVSIQTTLKDCSVQMKSSMHYVFYGDTVPEDFQEQVPFFSENPYVIHIKRFQTADIVPLHYADTVELLVCSGLCGEIVVNTECCPLGGDQVFLIPPYTLHSNRVEPSGGIMPFPDSSARAISWLSG